MGDVLGSESMIGGAKRQLAGSSLIFLSFAWTLTPRSFGGEIDNVHEDGAKS